MYNCITRDVDRELMPCLAKLNIRFFAYNSKSDSQTKYVTSFFSIFHDSIFRFSYRWWIIGS